MPINPLIPYKILLKQEFFLRTFINIFLNAVTNYVKPQNPYL